MISYNIYYTTKKTRLSQRFLATWPHIRPVCPQVWITPGRMARIGNPTRSKTRGEMKKTWRWLVKKQCHQACKPVICQVPPSQCYMYTYIYIYIFAHIYIHTYIHPCMHACMHACMYVCMYLFLLISVICRHVLRISFETNVRWTCTGRRGQTNVRFGLVKRGDKNMGNRSRCRGSPGCLSREFPWCWWWIS